MQRDNKEMDCTQEARIRTRITNIELMIEQYDAILLKLSLNPRASYSINTGQSQESVTAKDGNRIRALINGLESDLNNYYDQLCGTGDPTYTRPAW